MRSRVTLLVVLLLAVAALQFGLRSDGDGSLWRSPAETQIPVARDSAPAPGSPAAQRYPEFLPPEAITTLEAIERAGPFPYDRDGSVFANREQILPARPRGHYREYTVETPGSPDRGARRIVSGGDPPEVYYYTDDHYRSFRPIEVAR